MTMKRVYTHKYYREYLRESAAVGRRSQLAPELHAKRREYGTIVDLFDHIRVSTPICLFDAHKRRNEMKS